jgi:hypothetical protein
VTACGRLANVLTGGDFSGSSADPAFTDLDNHGRTAESGHDPVDTEDSATDSDEIGPRRRAWSRFAGQLKGGRHGRIGSTDPSEVSGLSNPSSRLDGRSPVRTAELEGGVPDPQVGLGDAPEPRRRVLQ